MTKINLLEKRKKSIEQRMNKLKEIEASLNAQLRKKRARRLIELGGLVSKAQLEDWNSNTLLGGLLFLKECEADSQLLEEWMHRGGVSFSSGEKPTKLILPITGDPVIVKFDANSSEKMKAYL